MRLVVLHVFVLLFCIFAQANAVYTKCQGEWNNTSSWRGGVIPVDGDSIFVNHSLHLLVPVSFDNNYVYLSEYGAICGEVEVTISYDSKLHSYGYLDLNQIYVQGSCIVYGSRFGKLAIAGGSYSYQDGGLKVSKKDSCPYYHQIFYSECETQDLISPSGNHVYYLSGTYLDTLSGTGGCDSIVSVDVMFHDSITQDTVSACKMYESPSGDYLWEESGIYTDILTNYLGCDSILEIDLTIIDCACEIFIPNAFTPDGSGPNNVFYPVGVCEYANFELVIYNRHNERLFVSDDPTTGWDGTYMSRAIRSGTYIYSIKYSNEITGDVNKYGVVTLIR
ncbi:MAG: gliding motility-associated-like protein [Glaciecola sp.]|jgi:gliding motility-associated-like protein